MSYRDRRYARADRLDGWADKREARATSDFAKVQQITDMIPMGQPILVGHHSRDVHGATKTASQTACEAASENGRKADEMASKAANIRAAADHAI